MKKVILAPMVIAILIIIELMYFLSGIDVPMTPVSAIHLTGSASLLPLPSWRMLPSMNPEPAP